MKIQNLPPDPSQSFLNIEGCLHLRRLQRASLGDLSSRGEQSPMYAISKFTTAQLAICSEGYVIERRPDSCLEGANWPGKRKILRILASLNLQASH